jgi:hypothetical protein
MVGLLNTVIAIIGYNTRKEFTQHLTSDYLTEGAWGTIGDIGNSTFNKISASEWSKG